MQKNNKKKSTAMAKLFQRELLMIKKYKSIFTLVIVYPILAAIALFSMFNAGVISKVPIAVIDQDRSALSRSIIQRLASIPEILVSERFDELTTAKKSLVQGEVYAVVLIPPNFESDSLSNKAAEVATFYNNQFMTVGSTLNLNISNAMSSILAQTQLARLTATGIPLDIAKSQLKPIPVDLHPLFNPTLNYLFTLVNGLYPTILQVIIMMAMVGSTLNDRFNRSGLQPLLRLANYRVRTLLFGKALPYFLFFTFCLIMFDLVLIKYYHLPLEGHLILLLMGSVLFVFTALLYGLLFALVVSDKARAYGLVGVFSSPAFGFTGLIFPRLAMNAFSYAWGAILPITWYLQIRLDQTLRAPDLYQSLQPFAYLLLQDVVLLTLITLLIRKLKRAKSS